MKHGGEDGEDRIDSDPIIQATPPISDSAFSRVHAPIVINHLHRLPIAQFFDFCLSHAEICGSLHLREVELRMIFILLTQRESVSAASGLLATPIKTPQSIKLLSLPRNSHFYVQLHGHLMHIMCSHPTGPLRKEPSNTSR